MFREPEWCLHPWKVAKGDDNVNTDGHSLLLFYCLGLVQNFPLALRTHDRQHDPPPTFPDPVRGLFPVLLGYLGPGQPINMWRRRLIGSRMSYMCTLIKQGVSLFQQFRYFRLRAGLERYNCKSAEGAIESSSEDRKGHQR